jgi:hypothetical protein
VTVDDILLKVTLVQTLKKTKLKLKLIIWLV